MRRKCAFVFLSVETIEHPQHDLLEIIHRTCARRLSPACLDRRRQEPGQRRHARLLEDQSVARDSRLELFRELAELGEHLLHDR